MLELTTLAQAVFRLNPVYRLYWCTKENYC